MPQSNRGADDSAKPPSALTRALTLLVHKARSRAALARQLAKEGYEEEDINCAVEAVQGYGYVHDGRLAESIAHAAVRRGKGPRWVEATLYARQVDPAERAPILSAARAQAKQEAVKTLRRRSARLPPLSERAGQAKAMRFLLGRGFSMGDATEAVAAVRAETVNADEMPTPQDQLGPLPS